MTNLLESEVSEYKNFAIQIAREAGKIILDNHGKVQQVEWVLRTNFRTSVDTQIDDLVRGEISRRFPAHNILSEENLPKLTGSDLTWVNDALDGTIPWYSGVSDHFAFCIALCKSKDPILGVVYAPKRDEMYVAVEGQGAYLNDQLIKVSGETNLNRVLMGADGGKANRKARLSYLNKLLDKDGITCDFAYGCASVPLCFVASGRMHAYLGTSLQPEDMAAEVILIREAGGKVTNLEGKEWTLDEPSILAANPDLHQNILDFLKNK